MSDELERAAEIKLVSDVEKFGWHCLSVEAGDGEPEFAYTVGLGRTFNHPELIIFGLSRDNVHGILTDAVTLIRNGTRFKDGGTYDDILLNYRCATRRVRTPEFSRYFGFAMWYYRVHMREPSALKAFQLVLPDRDGRFPWDEGVSPEYAAWQPKLYQDRVIRQDQA